MRQYLLSLHVTLCYCTHYVNLTAFFSDLCHVESDTEVFQAELIRLPSWLLCKSDQCAYSAMRPTCWIGIRLMEKGTSLITNVLRARQKNAQVQYFLWIESPFVKMCNVLSKNQFQLPWPDMAGEVTHWFLEQGGFGFWCQRRNPETGQALAGRGSWTSGGFCWAAVCLALLTSSVLPWRGKTVVPT